MNEISCKFVYYFFLHFLFCAIDPSLVFNFLSKREYLDNFYNLIISCLFTIQTQLLKLLSILIKKANRYGATGMKFTKNCIQVDKYVGTKKNSLAAQNADGPLYQFFSFFIRHQIFFFHRSLSIIKIDIFFSVLSI